MEQDKVTYILNYSSHLMTENESLAWRHHSTLIKQDKKDISEFSDERRQLFLKNGWITDNPIVLDLLRDGIDAFRENTAERILEDNGENVFFNDCPRCGKLTRTPFAKQCRFCGHDWH